MSVELLRTISLVAYLISGAFLLITIIVFVKLRIGEVIGEMTGISRRKAIKDIHRKSSEEKNGFYHASYARGKNTGRTDRETSKKLGSHSEKLGSHSEKLGSHSGKLGGYSGKLDGYSGKTGGLSGKLGGMTDRLRSKSRKTGRLSNIFMEDEGSQTVVLSEIEAKESIRQPARIQVITEIILCDTEDVIV